MRPYLQKLPLIFVNRSGGCSSMLLLVLASAGASDAACAADVAMACCKPTAGRAGATCLTLGNKLACALLAWCRPQVAAAEVEAKPPTVVTLCCVGERSRLLRSNARPRARVTIIKP